jgi:hypothetical protein
MRLDAEAWATEKKRTSSWEPNRGPFHAHMNPTTRRLGFALLVLPFCATAVPVTPLMVALMQYCAFLPPLVSRCTTNLPPPIPASNRRTFLLDPSLLSYPRNRRRLYRGTTTGPPFSAARFRLRGNLAGAFEREGWAGGEKGERG